MRRNEFERELHVGSVTGVRAFRVDALGRLRSANGILQAVVDTIFTPGENVAQCGHHRRKAPSEEAHGPDSLDIRDCMCGFYSYHSLGSSDVQIGAADDSVVGVVSCWGKITVGDKGMRATRCKLEALVLPGTRTTWPRYFVTCAVYALATASIIYGAAAHGLWADVAFLAGWVTLVLSMFFPELLGRRKRSGSNLDRKLAEKVRRNYPDVQIYSSTQKMLKNHPLSFGEGTPMDSLSPDTDPEFWIRRVAT